MTRAIVAILAFSFIAAHWHEAADTWNVLNVVLAKAEAVTK